MRKILYYILVFILMTTGVTACEKDDDLMFDEEFIIPTDTTLIVDTVFKSDTIFTNDTIIRPDTIIIGGDTIIKMDTIISCDTIVYKDTAIINKYSEDTLSYANIAITHYMDRVATSTAVQDADTYGKYLFQFQHSNSCVTIFDLEKKIIVGEVILPAVSDNHCNTVSFSNIFYNDTDEFPLLYVSGSTSGTYNHVQVYRVQHNAMFFTITKIQEIILPTASSINNLYWTGAVIDNTNNYMYVYANNYGAQIAKFKIPDFRYSEVTLTNKDIIERFSLPGFTHQQGACIRNDLMFVMDGVPACGDTNYLRIIDLKYKKDFKIINISELGYGNVEFESISEYDNGFILTAYSNRKIYSLKFN